MPAPRGVAPRSNAPPRLKPPSGLLQHHGHSPVRRRRRRITTPELYPPQQPCEDVSSGFQLHQRELVGAPLGFHDLKDLVCSRQQRRWPRPRPQWIPAYFDPGTVTAAKLATSINPIQVGVGYVIPALGAGAHQELPPPRSQIWRDEVVPDHGRWTRRSHGPHPTLGCSKNSHHGDGVYDSCVGGCVGG